MRLPNGYGSVTKLSGKRRNPYRVRITIDWEPNEETKRGKQIYQTIGYAKSRADGLAMLAEYHKNPYTIEASNVTFKEIFEKWSEKKFEKAETKSTKQTYNAAYKHCSALYDMKFVEIKADHLQDVIDSCQRSSATKQNIKILFNQLYAYAIKNDVTGKDYSEFVDIGKREKSTKRKPFTDTEIQKLWDNVDRLEFIDTILILIYSGMRIGELIEMKNENVNIEDRTMIGGIKTEAGKDRLIPINEKILPFVAKWKEVGHEYLFVNPLGKQVNYYTYRDTYWKRIVEQLELGEHLPHDTRHTFATLMDNAGANKLSIKKIDS
jgi:integrase